MFFLLSDMVFDGGGIGSAFGQPSGSLRAAYGQPSGRVRVRSVIGALI
ncbi:MAG: hypothetical protein MJ001_07495 [Paludibacteraceae bacterium]|nr:hypothetical protein [Paludibacteraceae bacterium]